MVTRSQPMVGVVDIGSNSVRLLITNGSEESRFSTVTGLATDLIHSGQLSPEAMDRTLEILFDYRAKMESAGVIEARVIATAATREASNGVDFANAAARAIGKNLEVIPGEREARWTFEGATSSFEGLDWTLIDIGGGSTEIVTAADETSYPVGSVKVTDEYLDRRPVGSRDLAAAAQSVGRLFADQRKADRVIGAAGTWTTLASMEAAASGVERIGVLTKQQVDGWVDRLATLSFAETRQLPGLDPARGRVILGGAVIAAVGMEALEVEEAVISDRDILDGVAATLLG